MRIFGIVGLFMWAACGIESGQESETAREELSGLSSGAACDASTAPVPVPCVDTGFQPDSDATRWRHWSSKVIAAQTPRHRAVDRIFNPGQAQTIVGKIAYGLIDKDLKDEVVEIWVQQQCDQWTKIGQVLTTAGDGAPFEGVVDDGGRVFFTLPQQLPVGDWRVRLLVKGDHSSADLWIHVWERGTKAVISDIDGTMTQQENDGLWTVFDPDAGEPHPAAPELMQAYFAKGYRVIFLTARPEFLTDRTRAWFADEGFPFATFHLSQSNFGEHGAPAQAYKADYLEQLASAGVEIAWAYGNKVTDLGAYLEAGLQEIVLISGEYSGDLKGATMVDDYISEAARVACLPPLK